MGLHKGCSGVSLHIHPIDITASLVHCEVAVEKVKSHNDVIPASYLLHTCFITQILKYP